MMHITTFYQVCNTFWPINHFLPKLKRPWLTRSSSQKNAKFNLQHTPFPTCIFVSALSLSLSCILRGKVGILLSRFVKRRRPTKHQFYRTGPKKKQIFKKGIPLYWKLTSLANKMLLLSFWNPIWQIAWPSEVGPTGCLEKTLTKYYTAMR